MKKIHLIGLIVTVLLFSGCKNKNSVPAFKVDNFSTGKAGEMILAIDSAYWTPAAVKDIYSVLHQPQPAINQIEPMFDVIQCSNSGLTSSFLRHRNILQFDYNPKHSNNTFELIRNPITNPQVLVKIRGNSCDSMLALLHKNEETIVKAFYDNDIARLQNAHRKLNNAVLEKKIKEKFGITMTIPDGYFIGREEEDFLWLCFRTPKNDRFIMIYKSPFYEINKENIIAERNRITKAYIQGAVQGAYPVVAEVNGFPADAPKEIRYHSGMELRGLWASVRDKMGGPFYSFTMATADKSSCITIDGFVYAPQENKRDYLREVEAIVKSLQ